MGLSHSLHGLTLLFCLLRTFSAMINCLRLRVHEKFWTCVGNDFHIKIFAEIDALQIKRQKLLFESTQLTAFLFYLKFNFCYVVMLKISS